MNKLLKAINTFYKIAISKKEFYKLIKGKEQFAIISTENSYERSFADEKAYRLAPIITNENENRGLIPVEKERNKNLRKHKNVRDDLLKDYSLYEVDAHWAEDVKSLANKKESEMKKERSLFLKNISFHNAYSLAQKYGQDSFIFKPAFGPPQLISTNTSKPIWIAKKYAYSSSNNLFSTFLHDNSSIWFGFFYDGAIELPNYGTPYLWSDPAIKDLLLEEISEEEAEKTIDKPKEKAKLSDEMKWVAENQIKQTEKDANLSKLLEEPEKWKGRNY